MKHAGLLICAAAATGFGIWRSVDLYRKSKLLCSLASFAKAIREGVVEYALDQKTIYERFRDKHLEEQGFLQQLLRETDKRPWGALYRTSKVFFDTQDPGKEAKDAFLAFASDFGTLGMAEQAAACDGITQRLSALAEKNRKVLWNEIRLSLTTGITAGCGILILFW